MSTAEKKIFLGKKGKIHGPFTKSEIENFHESGDINNYTFIWDAQTEVWNPLEMPPPNPEGRGRSSANKTIWHELKVLCHDFTNLVSGTLENVSDMGCELLTQDPSDYPRLALKSSVILNLMDPKSEKSMSVKTRVSNFERRNGHWIYRLSWSEMPKLTP